MTVGPKRRIKLPETVAAGDVFTIKAKITHHMENGFRLNQNGGRVPRDIIHRFHCSFEGETVIDVALEPGVASHPFFAFEARVPHGGEFTFTWYDDDGTIHSETRSIDVI